MARSAKPPTTPPAIAPTCDGEEVEEEELEAEGDEDVLEALEEVAD